MDLGGESNRPRIVGDYEFGDKIGFGSFAVVWRSRHRTLGTEFAIKEIDRKHLNENMLKEISILRNINHPNIIRLFESIETEDRIFLVLEYCDGGDLGGYLHRHGRVSADVARHFMRQLAAGLQVLHHNHLIHRDLKPQNLLLSSKDLFTSLKIGDFGFARYLPPGDALAQTLCGSPLYMAPEIIQNQKYGAKADLWSVGAILFQLVTGRPPFHGNSHLELFRNILSSSEPQFPPAALRVLNPDCVDLCKRLLRQNPVERLTFEEFFNHNFLVEPRATKGKAECSSAEETHQVPNDAVNQHRVADSMELIEREYVLVNSHFASTESLSSAVQSVLIDSSNAGSCGVQPGTSTPATSQMNEAATSSIGEMGKTLSSSTRLHLLQQYAHALSVLAQEKLNGGSHLESLSLELTVLAIWKEIIRVCGSQMEKSKFSRKETVDQGGSASCSSTVDTPAFLESSGGPEWARSGFLAACERAEKLANHLQETDGNATLPDAIELIYQIALTSGKTGAVDELMENREGAETSYSRAVVLLSFIALEAPSLLLSPPFSLHAEDKKRILNYIRCLERHKNRLRARQQRPTSSSAK